VNQAQLGTDPGLYLETLDASPIDSDAVYDFLIGASKLGYKVEVTVGCLGWNLWTLLACMSRDV
jgi:hypothetical protein